MKFQWKQFAVIALVAVAMLGLAASGGSATSEEDVFSITAQDTAMNVMTAQDVYSAGVIVYAGDFESSPGVGTVEARGVLISAKERHPLDYDTTIAKSDLARQDRTATESRCIVRPIVL